MKPNQPFFVRQAARKDIAALVEVERRTFGASGTDCYGEDYFSAWLDIHPEGLWLAESAGRAVGYGYAQGFRFEFDRLNELTTHDEVTDCGYTRSTHRPDGNSLYGLAIASIAPGAGRALLGHMLDLTRRLGKTYFLGSARIAGFDNYMKTLEDGGHPVLGAASEAEIALWYAHACAEMTRSKVWPTMPRKPALALPTPAGPDPVLNKHIAFSGYGMASLLPKYMRDPQSRHYGVCVVYRNPEIR